MDRAITVSDVVGGTETTTAQWKHGMNRGKKQLTKQSKKPKKKAKPKDFTACDLQSVFILVADIAELAKKKKPTDAQKAKLRILVDAYKRLPLPVRRAVHAASSRS